jgi:hypothetical protein
MSHAYYSDATGQTIVLIGLGICFLGLLCSVLLLREHK